MTFKSAITQNKEDIRLLKNIFTYTVAALVGVYLLAILLFRIPAVQQGCADAAAEALRDKLGTEVSIGSLKPGFPNRLILDDIALRDQHDTLMLHASRIAAKVELWPLLKRRIRISNAQLFGAHMVLYRPSDHEPENFRFLIDAFSSQDTTSHPIDLRIGSLLVRRSSLRYDHYGRAPKAEGRLDPNHLLIDSISLNAQLREMTPDSLNLVLSKLSLHERSGLHLERVDAHLAASPQGIQVPELRAALSRSELSIHGLSLKSSPGNMRLNRDALLKAECQGQLEGSVWLPELAPLIPPLANADEQLSLSTAIEGRDGTLRLPNLAVSNRQGETLLSAAIEATDLDQRPSLMADVAQLTLRKSDAEIFTKLFPEDLRKADLLAEPIFPVSAHGTVSTIRNLTQVDMEITTEMGRATINGTLDKEGEVNAKIRADNIVPTKFLKSSSLSDLGSASLTSHLTGKIKDANGRPDLRAQGVIESVTYRGYPYHDIRYEGSVSGERYTGSIGIQDKNGDAEIQVEASKKGLNCYAALVDVCPHELKFTDRFEGERFTLNLDAELAGRSLDEVAGRVRIGDLCIHSEGREDCLADSIVITSRPEGSEKHLTLTSPFLKANIDGQYQWQNLGTTLKGIMQAYLPSIFKEQGARHAVQSGKDDVVFSATIQDTVFLARLAGKDIAIPQPSVIDGRMDGNLNLLTFNAQVPELTFGKERLQHIDCHAQSTPQQMQLSMLLERQMKGRPVTLGVNAFSNDDKLRTQLHWNGKGRQTQIGEIDVTGHFYKDMDGRQAIRGDINPSNLIINDTVWNVHPARFDYHDGVVDLSGLRLSKADKYLSIGGRISPDEQDSLVADLHQINLAYIFDLINFHTVEFDGEATGRVYAKDLRGKPRADAFLQVENFTFNGGPMGHMDVHGNWGDDEDGGIMLDALISDPAANHQTTVRGTIRPGKTNPKGGINLDIRTRRCNLHFLNKYTSSIFTGLKGRATGWVRVFGPFKKINLEGEMMVDEATTHVNALGVDYHLAGDSVILSPDNILIRQARIYDQLGHPGMNEHCAILDVHLRHQNLKHLRYDVQAEARNVLGYDFRELGDMSFCGTIFASGNIKISGQSGEMTADISGTPMPGSTIVYNSTSPETITEAGFITYKENISPGKDTLSPNSPTSSGKEQDDDEEEESESDLRLNFNLDITPDATLRVLMDTRSGDYINLHGNGHILANYYNKGKFGMYGTYHVEDGIYKLSLQDVIRKDFQFQQGGTISFGGNAQQASLNLKAVYNVPNVSLDDLSATSLGLSNTRVDCIMNITGRPLEPVVTFDFDLPNANEDEKEMVRQMVSTEEERNMQVIYLLGIGRFYSYESQYAAGSNQGTTAMNSFLSSSLSNQFNQILSNAMGTDKWSFGANLRTGETGWDQLDVEGILSGRLLNNRLLINGNFGYRESYYSTNNFIGDFDVRYLLTRSGSLALKAYNQTNDRYFIQSSLTTQGIGLQIKKDFDRWRELLPKKKQKRKAKK